MSCDFLIYSQKAGRMEPQGTGIILPRVLAKKYLLKQFLIQSVQYDVSGITACTPISKYGQK